MTEELLQKEINIDEIETLITERKFTKLKELLSETNPADMAAIFEEIDKKYRLLLFRALPK